MNILLIAPYRTESGWGFGSKNLAKALNTLDHNLAIRPIYMSNQVDNNFNDQELLELEKKQYPHYDLIIQRVLPHLFRQNPNSINALTCVFETSNIQTTPWWRYLNLADLIFVPSKHEKETLDRDNAKPPVYNISEPIDIEKYKNEEYTKFPELQDTFNFYFIGEFVERKNIKALVTAFHREFRPNEPVNLVIKTAGQQKHIYDHLLGIKQNLRIFQDINRYKKEIVILDRFNEEQMHSLHKNCHCMVMPSYGEAFCRPVVDALGYGNTPIVTENTGMTDYMKNENGYIVKSRTEPVFTTQPPLKDIYTTKENWESIDILDLMKKMRLAYKNKHKPNIDMEQFSYKTIGQKIQKSINDFTNKDAT